MGDGFRHGRCHQSPCLLPLWSRTEEASERESPFRQYVCAGAVVEQAEEGPP
jgi:hypothetical protein